MNDTLFFMTSYVQNKQTMSFDEGVESELFICETSKWHFFTRGFFNYIGR